MKVKDAVEMLTNNYPPDEEILIMWWDKDWVENATGDEVSNDEMADLDSELNEAEVIGTRVYDFIENTVAFYRSLAEEKSGE